MATLGGSRDGGPGLRYTSGMTSASISTRARAHLRSLAHHLEPVVQVGGEGLSAGLEDAVKTALFDHELIKVRVGQGYEGDRKEFARELAERVEADLTQIIGRVVVLYRPRDKDLPGRPRIVLPPGV